MRVSGNAGWCVIVGGVCLLVFARPAYGYIDPGTGSFVIQLLVGSALGCLLAIKIFWRKITSFLGGLFGRKRGADLSAEGAPPPEAAADQQEGPEDVRA